MQPRGRCPRFWGREVPEPRRRPHGTPGAGCESAGLWGPLPGDDPGWLAWLPGSQEIHPGLRRVPDSVLTGSEQSYLPGLPRATGDWRRPLDLAW